jgi:hypothetical protein
LPRHARPNLCASPWCAPPDAYVLFSFIATCERHHLNPFEYLRDVLSRIAQTPVSRLAELLPGRWKQA